MPQPSDNQMFSEYLPLISVIELILCLMSSKLRSRRPGEVVVKNLVSPVLFLPPYQ